MRLNTSGNMFYTKILTTKNAKHPRTPQITRLRRDFMLKIAQFTDEIILAALFVLFFCTQLFLCLKMKNVFVRLIPTFLTFAVTAVLFAMIYISNGWDRVGYLLLTIYSAILFLCCIAAWIIYAIIKLIQRFKKETKNNML